MTRICFLTKIFALILVSTCIFFIQSSSADRNESSYLLASDSNPDYDTVFPDDEIREIYKKRYIYLMKLLDEHLKNEISYIPPDGGLSLWIKLKASISVDKLSDILLSRNVIISPGSLFSLSKESHNYFRLSFAAVNEKQIHEGILILKEVLNNMNSDPASVEPIL